MSTIKTWQEVINDPAFQELSPEDKTAVRNDYFDSVMYHDIVEDDGSMDDIEAVRKDFYSAFDFSTEQQEEPIGDVWEPTILEKGIEKDKELIQSIKDLWAPVSDFLAYKDEMFAKNKEAVREELAGLPEPIVEAVTTVGHREATAPLDAPSLAGRYATKGLQQTDVWQESMMDDEILSMMEKDPEMTYDKAFNIIAERQQRIGETIGDAVALSIPGSAVKAVTVPQKLARGVAVGATSEAGAKMAHNVRYDKDLTEGVSDAALEGALFGTAGEAIAPAIKTAGKGLVRGTQTVLDTIGDTKYGKPVGKVGDWIEDKMLPSKKARDLNEKMTEVNKLKSQEYKLRGEIEDVANARVAALTDEHYASLKSLDNNFMEATAALDTRYGEMMSVAVSPSQKAAIAKRYERELEKLMKNMDESEEYLSKQYLEGKQVTEELAQVAGNKVYDDIIGQNVLMKSGGKDITAGDLLAFRDKVLPISKLSEEGADLGVSSAASQLNKGEMRNIAMSLRSVPEKVSDTLPGFMNKMLGLTTEGAREATEGVVNKSISESTKKVERATSRIVSKAKVRGISVDVVEDLTDSLKERAKLLDDGDIEGVLKNEEAYEALIKSPRASRLPAAIKDQINEQSRELKTLRKVAKEASEPVKASLVETVFPYAAGAIDIGSSLVRGSVDPLSAAITTGAVATGQKVTKALGKSWKKHGTRRAFDEINKAMNGTLKWNKTAERIIENTEDITRAIARISLEQALGEE